MNPRVVELAEKILVLSEISRIRGGAPLHAVESKLLSEATAAMASLVSGVRPRDLVDSDSARLMAVDLRLKAPNEKRQKRSVEKVRISDMVWSSHGFP